MHLVLLSASARLVTAKCKKKQDDHGTWTGSTEVNGVYTLTCLPGFGVGIGRGNTTQYLQTLSITCGTNEIWAEDPVCVNADNCGDLMHNCGTLGICVDEVGDFHCDCEEGAPQARATDGTGETICGDASGFGECAGSTCGAKGVCIDLSEDLSEIDSGSTGYRCACADGYFDNNRTCKPLQCGRRADPYGIWEGDHSFNGKYTLHCYPGSFLNDMLSRVTVSCPVTGIWPNSTPVCVNAWQESVDAEVESFRFYVAVSCSFLCVLCAALAAGLTMGLVSLTNFDLQLLMHTRREDCSTDEELNQLDQDQKAASRVLPLLKDHHKLLVTLLLLNSIANEALPIFLDQVVPSLIAVLLSVTCVLFFGEIFPSALFTGPSQLSIAASLSPVVRCLQAMFLPFSFPIKVILDRLVGHAEKGPKYTRAQLRALLELHREGVTLTARSTEASSSKNGTSSEDELLFEVQTPKSRSLFLVGAKEPWLEVNTCDETDTTYLSSLECEAAQQCLKLGSIEIRSLYLPYKHSCEAVKDLPSIWTNINTGMTVSEALQLMQRLPQGRRCTVSDENGFSKGSCTREDILWAALMEPRKPQSESKTMSDS